MRTLMGSVLFSLLFTNSQAQVVRPSLSATAVFPNAYSLKEADAFSFLTNLGALANINMLAAGVYGERRFLVQELAFYQAALVVPTTSGQFGFRGGYLGNSAHYEAVAGLAYGRKLGTKLAVGAQFNYYTMNIAGYGSASAVYIEASALWQVHPQVHVGLHISNPTAAAVGKTGERELLPTVYTAGVGYAVSEQFLVAGEVQKTLHGSLGVNAGVQYRFDERLWARAGFRSGTAAYYLGMGVGLKAFRLDATASVHPQLGVTPGVQLLFTQKEKAR